MARGGKREGAGRKAGAATKRTREIADKAHASGMMPLDYLLKVMRDRKQSGIARLDAAKAAAPYVHPKLNAVAPNGEAEPPTPVKVEISVVDARRRDA